MCTTCLWLPTEARGHKTLQLEFQMEVSCLMWVLEPEPERAVSALNCGATSPVVQRRNKRQESNLL